MRRVTAWDTTPVAREPDTDIPWRGGSLRARAYRPSHVSGRGILLLPGVHASGIDEPRLVGFAHDIAAMGHPVLTVELPDLARYQITTRTTDMIEDAAAWMERRPEYRGRDGRIGMLGISFGGGLSLVAAGRPSIKNGLAFAMAFGGHADLPRTLKYLCTGVQADGTRRPPHDYGLAIVLLGVADRLVPASQAPALKTAILSYLEASRLDMIDKTQAAREFDRAKALAAALPEPSKTYMDYVNRRDVAHLGPLLLPHLVGSGRRPRAFPRALAGARLSGLPPPRHGRQRGPRNRIHAARAQPSRAGAHRAPAADPARDARGGGSHLDRVGPLAADRLLVGPAR